MKFGELGLSKNLLRAIQKSGYEEATPIQEQTIPLVLAGQAPGQKAQDTHMVWNDLSGDRLRGRN